MKYSVHNKLRSLRMRMKDVMKCGGTAANTFVSLAGQKRLNSLWLMYDSRLFCVCVEISLF